jgi:LPXTG-motif cell wall-anchored protein
MTVSDVLVNCPIVPADSTLSEGGAPLVQGWYQGQEVYYFDFGENTVAAAPIYAFITGFDDSGAPVFVEGQHNVIDVIPGDEGYSAFWYVNLVTVPEGYEANTITSVEAVLASGYDTVQPGLLVNCPVLRTAEAPAAEETMMEAPAAQETPTPTQLPATGGAGSVSLAWMGLIVGGAVLAGAGLVLLFALARKAQAN